MPIKVIGPYKGIAIGKTKNGKYQAILKLLIVDGKGTPRPLSPEEQQLGFTINSNPPVNPTISTDRIIKKRDGSQSKVWKATITADKPGMYQLTINRQGEPSKQYILHFPPSSDKFQMKVLDLFFKVINNLYRISTKRISAELIKTFKLDQLEPNIKETPYYVSKVVRQNGLYYSVIDELRKKYPKAWKVSVEKMAYYLSKLKKQKSK